MLPNKFLLRLQEFCPVTVPGVFTDMYRAPAGIKEVLSDVIIPEAFDMSFNMRLSLRHSERR